jgi:hypothetical protein
MNMTTKNDIFKEHLKKWLAAGKDRKARKEITEHICFVSGIHPKSVPRSFRRLQMAESGATERRGRKQYYTPDAIAALKFVWDAAGEPCGENLHAIISEYVKIFIRDGDWKYSDEATKKLLKMSLGTVKNRVAKFERKGFITHGKSTTSPSSIHALIPIRNGDWDKAGVGTGQIDTVAHCGDSLAGDFVYTVNSTDVPTLWGSRRAQWNKGKVATVANMEYIENDLPFKTTEWHPDSGSEFINWHCYDWCKQRGVKLSRSRPNRKNDNCFVEERNGHIVRKWVGFVRFDASEVVDALNAVYDVLTPYLNHFAASRRIMAKERIGSKWKITREKKAKTPFARVLERNDIAEGNKEKLRQEHAKLNPLAMKNEIDRRLKTVFDLQKHRGSQFLK